ncbi:GNAT family N-acetyltransferase [Nocardia sp. NPDC050697]|uniref:GNAT family N-acetyltransferase n=1 Tax=Nocardia sp. NPDC050697 TaxID=3155158 RepID=UPI00340ADF8E
MIERADFTDPALLAFLRAHLTDLAPTAPPESRHALHLDALRAPAVRLWVLRHDGAIAATGALATLEPGHEELKSMRTDPARRGRGLGRAMLTHLLRDAASRGITRISLETGSMPFFAPARRLYTAAGFTPCPPFGGYRPDPNSSFFTLVLGDQGG